MSEQQESRNENGEAHGPNDTMVAPDATMCTKAEEDAQGSVTCSPQIEYSGFGIL